MRFAWDRFPGVAMAARFLHRAVWRLLCTCEFVLQGFSTELIGVCCARVNCNLANCLTKHFARAAVCAHVGIGAPRANVYFFGL